MGRVRHCRTHSDIMSDPRVGMAGVKVNFKKKMDPNVFGTEDIVTHKHGYDPFGTHLKKSDTIKRNDKNKKEEEHDWFMHSVANLVGNLIPDAKDETTETEVTKSTTDGFDVKNGWNIVSMRLKNEGEQGVSMTEIKRKMAKKGVQL